VRGGEPIEDLRPASDVAAPARTPSPRRKTTLTVGVLLVVCTLAALLVPGRRPVPVAPDLEPALNLADN